ncbi:hypothetical protein SO802_006940 [Lithocarpus litseifolius]|uniref:Protein BZR1 homolog n=1 Tax=Lithocarpus litseifolius TaxID=425828 RepID=A0AAW2DMN5_9ROSI
MKEAAMGNAVEEGEASGTHQGRTMKRSNGGSSVGRTESEKEKTKMRERNRRAITTKIFQGLRKHGGYCLSPRADINELLRHLASEAGWVVLPDGTTFRSSTTSSSNGLSCCAMCGTGITSNNTTPCSSVVMGGGGGEYCASTTASPIGDSISMSMSVSMVNNNINKIGFVGSTSCSLPEDDNSPLELYIYANGLPGGLHHHPSSASGGCVGGPLVMGPQYPQQQQQQSQLYVQEAMASNQNTPVGSPLRRA